MDLPVPHQIILLCPSKPTTTPTALQALLRSHINLPSLPMPHTSIHTPGLFPLSQPVLLPLCLLGAAATMHPSHRLTLLVAMDILVRMKYLSRRPTRAIPTTTDHRSHLITLQRMRRIGPLGPAKSSTNRQPSPDHLLPSQASFTRKFPLPRSTLLCICNQIRTMLWLCRCKMKKMNNLRRYPNGQPNLLPQTLNVVQHSHPTP